MSPLLSLILLESDQNVLINVLIAKLCAAFVILSSKLVQIACQDEKRI